VSLAFNAIIVLIVAGPLLAVVGNTAAGLFPVLITAAGLAAVAADARNADADQFWRAGGNLFWLALTVPFWILLQLCPLPPSLSHPIWSSANEALQTGSFGHITADLGATLRSLMSALAAIGLVTVTMVAGRDRRRAELLLLAASAITTLLALAVLGQNFIAIGSLTKVPADVSIHLASFGVVLNLATVLLAVERRETRHAQAAPFVPIGIGGAVGVVINGLALLQTGGLSSGMATGFGLAVLLLLLIVRRLGLTLWPRAALMTALFVGGTLLAGWLFDKNPNAPALLRFVPALPAEQAGSLARMLTDGRWFGSGAGTFEDVARIYQGADTAAVLMAPTTASALSIELGWVGLIAVLALAGALLVAFIRGALRRGRDWFFSGAAAACVTIAACEAFIGSGLLHPAVATLTAIIVGLGLSQRYGQTARQ